MRIGFITGEYPPMQGGVGAFTQEMAKAMAALGHEPRVLTSINAAEGNSAAVPVDAIVKRWRWGTLRAAEGWARLHALDVVNIQYQTAAYNMSPYIHLLPRRLSKTLPVFTTFHDLREPYLFPKAGGLRTMAVLMLARDASGAIVTNREDEEILAADPNIAHLRRIAIGSNISAGVLPERSNQAKLRKKIGAEKQDLVIGYFGFLNESKGAHVLIGAAAKARDAGVPVRVLMIGGRVGASDTTNKVYGNTIDGLIDYLGLGDQIHWTGFVDDDAVSGYFGACDLCALPYRDGVSFRRGTFMAAIAHGCAVVTTLPFIDIPELVAGENVYLVQRRDADALAEAIIDLADKPKARTRLGVGALALAEMFTWDKLAAQTVAFFEEAMKKR